MNKLHSRVVFRFNKKKGSITINHLDNYEYEQYADAVFCVQEKIFNERVSHKRKVVY